MRSLIPFALLLAAPLGVACLESVDAPAIPTQGTISYGTRIYLVDDTFDADGNRRDRNAIDNVDSDLPAICSRLTTVADSVSGATDTLDDLLANPAFMATDDRGDLTRDALRSPQNCFIPLESSGELAVDTTEVTVRLYQFCIDSGFCNEPDPSEFENKGDLCVDDEEGFEDCPIVGVSQSEAQQFCTFLGRRLPTAFEAIAIRQHGWGAGTDTRAPDDFLPFPTGQDAPAECADAHLQRFDCGPPQRLSPPTGAAPRDAITAGDNDLFDLEGHVAEWVEDGFPSNRGLSDEATGADSSLPWFCLALVDTDPATGAPVCPSIEGDMDPFADVSFPCIYGYYDPDEAPSSLGLDPAPPGAPDLPYGLYPVCLTSNSGVFQGGNGALFGGSYVDIDDDLARVFSRRIEPAPDNPATAQQANSYGFRCVDNFDIEAGEDGFSRPQIDDDF